VVMLKFEKVMVGWRLLNKCDVDVLTLLHAARTAKHSWVSELLDAMRWVAARSAGLAELRAYADVEIFRFMYANGRTAKSAIRKAFMEPLLRLRVAWDLKPAGGRSELPIFTAIPCDLCERSFANLHSMRVHRAREHKMKGDERKRVDSSLCPICLVLFANRVKCLEHIVEKSAVCRMNLLINYEPFDRDLIESLDEADRADKREGRKIGLSRGVSTRPAIRVLGPMWPILGSDDGYAHPLGPNRRVLAMPTLSHRDPVPLV
jgi:hypothetical protein